MFYDPQCKPAVVPKVVEPWQQVILDMIKVLEKRGWCQHRIKNSRGNICLAGALLATQQRLSPSMSFITAVSFITALPAGDAWERIGNKCTMAPQVWNDRKGRTKEQVIDMLHTLVG